MPNTQRRQSLSEGKHTREGWASRKRGAPGRLTATALALAAVLPAPAAFAQAQGLRADAGEVTTLGSVVVTGEKVRRTVKETASSVAVIGNRHLQEQPEAAAVRDVTRNVPNVLYTGPGSAPVIRGVDGQGASSGAGAFYGGTVPRARVNVDGHNLNFWETAFGTTSIWDVDSVEVYRGPQTAALGANSIAGSVIVNTKDPTFKPEGAAQLQLGSRKARRASVMLSRPLVDEELAARIALDYSSRDTYINYVNPTYSKGNTDTSPENINGRIKLLWTPGALPGLESKLTLSYLRGNLPTSEAANDPHDQLNNATLTMPTFNTHGWTGVHDLAYDLGSGVRLDNQLQYSRRNTERVSVPMSNGGAHMDSRDFSEELRASFKAPDNSLSGMAGVYYNNVDADDLLYLRGTSSFHDKKDSLGVFTEMSWRLAPQWSLTGGLRYQHDSVKRNGTSSAARMPLAFDETYHKLLPKVSLAYDVSPDWTVGALVSRGYNPGGAGLRTANGSFYKFNPETMWNYELFTRIDTLGDRLVVNANLFWDDRKDSQVNVPDYVNGRLMGNVVRNADESRSYGLEVSADYKALDSLDIRASAGLLRTKIHRFSDPDGVSFEGNEFGRSPRYMAGLDVNWNITDQLALNANVHRTDGYHSSDNNLPGYDVQAYTVANARLSYQMDRTWQFYAYVDNLFDARKPTWKFDDRSAGGIVIVSDVLEPRMYGVGVKVTF